MLARNFITTTLSTIINIMLSFLGTIVLARVLGAEKQGIYTLAVLIPNTAYFLGLCGLSTSYIVFSGKYPEKRGAIAFQSFAFPLFIGILVCIFYAYALIFSPLWFERFRTVGTFNLILASSLVSFELTWAYLRAGILGANRIFTINVGTVTTPLSKLILLVILVWWFGMGVTGGIFSQIGCFVFTIAYMAVATAMEVPVRLWRPDFIFFKKAFSLGIKIHLNQAAWYIARSADRYMIAYMIPNSDIVLGQYAIASQFTTIVWALPISMQTAFLPHLSVTQNNRTLLTAKATRMMLIVLFPTLLIMAICSPLIPVILGKDYTGSVKPFLWFLPGLYVFGATRALDSFLTHEEKPMYGVVNSWIGVLINMLLNLYYIPRMGINGAALSATLSTALMGFATMGCFIYETGVSVSKMVPSVSDFYEIFDKVKAGLKKVKTFI